MNLQSVVMNSDMFDEKKNAGGSDGKMTRSARSEGLPFSCSNTTVYQNLLNQKENGNSQDTEVPEVEMSFAEQEVDSEITFKIKQKCDSSSSDDHVNTSDELMNIDCDQFIADCQSAARGNPPEHKSEARMEEEDPFEKGNQMVHRAEVSKKKLLTNTTGRQDAQTGNINNPNTQSCTKVIDDEYMVIGGHVDNALQEML